MTPDLEHDLIANVATILERTGNQTRMLEGISKKQDITNGRVNELEKDYRQLNGTVQSLKVKGTELATEIKKGSKFFEMIKNNWKGAAFVLAIFLWIYEHGFIHIK